jgi:hypothetical protein
MKSLYILLSAGFISLVVGCSSTPVALAPVGPNPGGPQRTASQGELLVFSSLVEQSDNQNQGSTDPTWFNHTDYGIYTVQGKLVERVLNRAGHYTQAPRLVTLPAGHYVVKAEAKGYFRVEVPVTVEGGRTTRVHLDGNWKPPVDGSQKTVVSLPNGIPVGWRAEPSKELGINY